MPEALRSSWLDFQVLTGLVQVDLYSCFRPGDIVRAEVLSAGDARSYLLTTAKNELGVIFAKSLAGGGWPQ